MAYSEDPINKHDDPKNPDNPITAWLKDKGGKLTKSEIKKGTKISKGEFYKVLELHKRGQLPRPRHTRVR